MSEENILLLAAFGLSVLLVGVWLLYGFLRKDPVAERTGEKSTAFSRAKSWAFGTRKHRHFDGPEEALYYSPHRWALDVVFVLLLIVAVLYMNLDLNVGPKLFQSPKWADVSFTLKSLFQPDWGYFWGVGVDSSGITYSFTQGVIYQIFQTFGIAYIGTLIAAILALPFGLLASHKLFGRWAWISEIFLILIRTFPELLLGILMVAFSGISPLTGILAIGLHSIGMIGKLYAEQFDDLNMEPLEALTSAGASSWQKIHLGVLPEARPGLYSVALYRFDINIRTATILGVVVGADCGIGFSIQVMSAGSHWSKLGSCILGVVILIVIIDIFSSWLRKKLV